MMLARCRADVGARANAVKPTLAFTDPGPCTLGMPRGHERENDNDEQRW